MAGTSFDEALNLVTAAGSSSDVFGGAVSPARARSLYRKLAHALHPDHCPDPARRQESEDAFAHLASLWEAYADPTGTAGTRPRASHTTIQTRRNVYVLDGAHRRGDIANLYRADRVTTGAAAQGVVVKMPRDPRTNDLVEAEARNLAVLAGKTEERFRAYVPILVETFRHRDAATGIDRRVNVLERLEGCCTLADVARAHPRGLDARDAAWMWRRLLVALGVVHQAGLVHGAVVPEHVMIHPAEHGLVLVDFSYATDTSPLTAIVPRYRDWYPAEVAARQGTGPGTDIAMAARCMTTLMGDRAPRQMRAFAAGCSLRPLNARPDNAWQLLGELDELLERLYGPRQFRPFPAPPAAEWITTDT